MDGQFAQKGKDAAVDQEAPHKVVGRKGHDPPAFRAAALVILIAKGDAGFIERDQPTLPRTATFGAT
jgi:hypothetical protein